MNKLLAFLAAFAALTATAQPVGFFSRPDAAPALPQAEKEFAKALAPCAISVRYNVATPAHLEIAYIGAMSCYDTAGVAADAAYFSGPKALPTVGGEPAWPVTFECSILIRWDQASPSSASASVSGSGCGGDVESTALYETTRAVHCVVDRQLTCGP
jgi:hypothetical protein